MGDPVDPAPDLASGFCALLGLPNAGKSTLLNRVLGVDLCAVSAKPQTTRNRIVGVKNLPAAAGAGAAARAAQIVFVDTPGLQRGKGALRRYLIEQALAAVADCDVALVLVDVTDVRQRTPSWLDDGPGRELGRALGRPTPRLLALNKIDRLRDKSALLPILAAYADGNRFAEHVPISARSGDGVAELLGCVARHLPAGPRLFPEEMITDRAERFLCAEKVREQLCRQLGDELPYASAVIVDSYTESARARQVKIAATIYVERESQKGIVVGKGGARIKAVGEAARLAMGRWLGCPVHLALHVRVAPAWTSAKAGLKRMGYDE
jgi:GTP-binding protein Era